MYDLEIRNALIYDGSGKNSYHSNVTCKGGKIVYIGEEEHSAKHIVEADGLALAPGFIDCHSHSDQSITKAPHRENALRMGVTTEIAGQCGHSISLDDGLNITLDAYPYTAASTTTLSAIPPQFLSKGVEMFANSLNNPDIVDAIYREIFEVNDPSWDNSIYYVGLENFLIVRAKETPYIYACANIRIKR